jgi:uncharacterized protein (DUF1697 family)
MTRCIALLRGINVGKAKRLAMADLRALCAELGYTDVRTLLNSGNVVFRTTWDDMGAIAGKLAAALADRFGFPVPVVVLDAEELDTVIAENTLLRPHDDPSRFLVAFVDDPRCPGGVADSELLKAFTRTTVDAATARNWSTVLKLQAAAAALADPS